MKQNVKLFVLSNLALLVAAMFLFNPSPMGEVAGETPSYTLNLTSSDPVSVVSDFGQKTFRSVTLIYSGVSQATGYHVRFTPDYGGIIYNDEFNPITGIKSISAVFSGGPLTLKTGASYGNYYTSQEYSGSFTATLTRGPSFFSLESFPDVTVNITSVTITYSCVAPIDGIVYTLNGDHYEVTDYTGNPTTATIEATHEGLPVTVIANSAFYKSALTSINLPEGIETIGAFAFRSCQQLTSITIPSTVTSIGNYAFEACLSMTQVNISTPSVLSSLGNNVFSNCLSLGQIDLPEGINNLPWYAFFACSSLTRVVIPVSVVTVWNYAFGYCDALTEVYYRGNATQWGNIGQFDGNTWLWNAPRYYYSATPLSGAWYYSSGTPTLWP